MLTLPLLESVVHGPYVCGAQVAIGAEVVSGAMRTVAFGSVLTVIVRMVSTTGFASPGLTCAPDAGPALG
jgi:hypothetical protein